MAVNLLIKTYSHVVSQEIEKLIEKHVQETWLSERHEEIFRICDELIKNAVKSNYKFLLIWLNTRKRVMESFADFTVEEADDWLNEVFFCGENLLIEKQLEKIPNWDSINVNVRNILNLENKLFKERERNGRRQGISRELLKSFEPLRRIKRLSQKLNIGIHFRIESAADQLIITVQNDAPILTRDVERINNIRSKFKDYADQGKHHAFFVENLDTSGGGHGLGYALMDSILLDMKVEPEKSLFLVAAGRTMVLLALPLHRD